MKRFLSCSLVIVMCLLIQANTLTMVSAINAYVG